jgi:DNA invertase Pin-like site-specific DNA recombinase
MEYVYLLTPIFPLEVYLKLGRPKVDQGKIEIALRMYDSKEYSVKEIVEGTGLSQGSLYRAINKRKLEKMN